VFAASKDPHSWRSNVKYPALSNNILLLSLGDAAAADADAIRRAAGAPSLETAEMKKVEGTRGCVYNDRKSILWRLRMCEPGGRSEASGEKGFEERVSEVIESIRPALQGHGGDVELIGIDGDNTVKVRLQGACQGCPGATMTMKMGIERILKEKVPGVKEVVAVA
jgi:Fe-S cluster biogenesis protein NfuA